LSRDFTPVSTQNEKEERVYRYQCTKATHSLDDENRRCVWSGKKSLCDSKKWPVFAQSNADDSEGLDNVCEQGRDRAQINQKAVKLVNISFEKATGGSIFEFAIGLMQLGASMPR
jgi:hypothetical protein